MMGLCLGALVSGCASPAGKPVDSPELRDAAKPALQGYLTRVVGKGDAAKAKLVSATPFKEGYTHETWKLVAEVGGETHIYVLKLFESEAAAKRDADSTAAARKLGWPVPGEVVRGTAEPYKPQPASLAEFVPGESIERAVQRRFEGGKAPAPDAVAALYAAVAQRLGKLHVAGRRKRAAGDLTGADQMRQIAEKCDIESWCGPHATKQFREKADLLDGEHVTFVHGALYETQVLLDTKTGELASFVDLDEAGWGDPATDLGSLLAHVLLVNPLVRKATWGVPEPEPAELKATGSAILAAYRKSSGLDDAAWAAFKPRVEGYMRVRIGQLLLQLRGNVHAKALIGLVDKRKVGLFAVDPFDIYEIAW